MTLFVIGNVTEDLVFRLSHLPRPGETLIARERLSDIGGKGLNQAVVASRCGIDVQLTAAIGRDPAGDRAIAVISGETIHVDIVRTDAPTDQSIITVAEDGENVIVSSAFAADTLTPERVERGLERARAGDRLLVQGNLGQEATRAALTAARARGVATVANPSPIRWEWGSLLPLVDTLILNRPETLVLSACGTVESGIEALRRAGPSSVLVTLGADGVLAATDEKRWHVPARAVPVLDTAGAGDTFCGVLLGALERGLPLDASLDAAIAAASLTVGRSGTASAFPSSAELAALLGIQR